MISIIVAVAENRVIGRDNQLIWHISEDLKRFKRLTENNTVVMGRKTYLSLPFRPLKNRRNIVISTTVKEIEGVEVVSSIDEAISLCRGDEVFIIGGASIYEQTLGLVDRIYLTVVCKSFEGDVYFPEIPRSEWTTIEKSELQTDEKSGLQFYYETLERKR